MRGTMRWADGDLRGVDSPLADQQCSRLSRPNYSTFRRCCKPAVLAIPPSSAGPGTQAPTRLACGVLQGRRVLRGARATLCLAPGSTSATGVRIQPSALPRQHCTTHVSHPTTQPLPLHSPFPSPSPIPNSSNQPLQPAQLKRPSPFPRYHHRHHHCHRRRTLP